MRLSYKTEETRDAYLLLFPLLLLLALFIAYPVVSNFRFALLDWKGFGTAKPIGLDNFKTMIDSDTFRISMLNTAILLIYVPISVITTVFIAALLREGLRGWGIFRSILYIPNLLGPVIMGVVLAISLRETGPVNSLLRSLGLGFLALDWLGSQHILFMSSASCMSLGTPWLLHHLFLSARSAIDPALYEAALMDGASWWKRFFHVTIPSIIFSIEFWTVLSFIEVFARMFGFIFALTKGGPGYSTFTLEYGIYYLAFVNMKMGLASAWASVLFIFCAIISVAQLKLMKGRGA
ncbi:sugar ABC transporter permease [Treponema sp.]